MSNIQFKPVHYGDAYMQLQKKKQDEEVERLREKYRLELEARQEKKAKELEKNNRKSIYDKLCELGFFSRIEKK